MHRPALLLVALLSGCGHAPPPATPDRLAHLDWAELELQHRALLTRLLRTDSAGPRGSEAAAARVLQSFLRRADVRSELIEHGGGHVSLIARLPPQEKKPVGGPIVLLSHLDTAPIDPIGWSRDIPPLALTAREGRLHGLGLIGGKGLAALHASALVALKRSQLPREHEVVLVAAAQGRTPHAPGLTSVLRRVPQLGYARVALAGGGPRVFDLLGDGRVTQLLSVADRGLAQLEVASTAPVDGPVGPVVRRLAAALVKVERPPPKLRLSPPGRAFLDALSAYQGFLDAWILRSELAIELSLPALAARPLVGAQFKDELRVLALQGELQGSTHGPRRARAVVNAMFLPGSSPGEQHQRLRRRLADPSLKLAILDAQPSSSSPAAGPAYEALRRQTQAPQLRVLPSLHPTPTGVLPLRQLGVPVYGYAPWELSVEAILRADSRRGRLDEDQLPLALHRLTRSLLALANDRNL